MMGKMKKTFRCAAPKQPLRFKGRRWFCKPPRLHAAGRAGTAVHRRERPPPTHHYALRRSTARPPPQARRVQPTLRPGHGVQEDGHRHAAGPTRGVHKTARGSREESEPRILWLAAGLGGVDAFRTSLMWPSRAAKNGTISYTEFEVWFKAATHDDDPDVPVQSCLGRCRCCGRRLELL
jgi:hypothetical protein